jgi:hypothetical protein
MRLEKRDAKTVLLITCYIGSDWQFNRSIETDYVKKVYLLEEDNEFAELSSAQCGYEFAMINRQLRNGKQLLPNSTMVRRKRLG